MIAPSAFRLRAARSVFPLLRALRPVFAWVLAEFRALRAWAVEPQLWALLLVGATLWSLAYTQPYRVRLDFGGDLATRRRYDDAPYLNGFNEPEPADKVFWYDDAWRASGQLPYRWTHPDAAIVLAGLGSGRWLVSLRASAAQPVTSRWSDGATTASIPLTGTPRMYYLLARSDNDLTLHLHTPAYVAPGDARTLGFVTYRATVQPTAHVGWPAFAQLGMLAGMLALVYGIARRLAASKCVTLLAGLAIAAALALLLADERLALTSFTPTLLAIAAGCYGLALLGSWAIENEHVALVTRAPAHPRARAPAASVVGLILLAFALRLGVLHPHAISSDTDLHRHNLENMTQGMLYFTEGLPTRSGGGDVPYPPGGYLLLAPLQVLLPSNDDARRVLVEIGTALCDALVVGVLWYTLRRNGVGERAALLGSALYIVAVPLLSSFSIGEYENILGQELALPLLAFLALSEARLRKRRNVAVVLVLLLLAVLGHLGVTISLMMLLVWLGVVWLVSREQRRAVVPLVAIGIVAAVLVGLCYHSAFVYLLETSRVSSARGLDLADWFDGVVTLLTGYKYLHPVLVWLGGLGVFLLYQRPSARSLCWLLVAWWGATLLSLVPPLGTSLRWSHFLYPALCLSAGPVLAALWRRGFAGRIATVGVLAALCWAGVAFWVTQLANYLHK